ncbi:hypothetical protein EDD86DRAFT_204522 [Gorgonomyces haynaldii]|nr:hypothetical protein EDD86DRAFT_204522 [Gorgonomyces haynaldii]
MSLPLPMFYNMVKDLESIARNVKCNKQKSLRLSDRITKIADLCLKNQISELDSLQEIVLEAIEFLQQFEQESSLPKRILNVRKHREQFELLNLKLEESIQHLSLEASVKIIREEDELDNMMDLSEIKLLLTDLQQQQTEQDQELHKKLDLLLQQQTKPLSREKEVLKLRIDPERIKLKEILGKGGFGVVYKANFNGETVAVKQLKCTSFSEKGVKSLVKEASIMKRLFHARIVPLYGVVEEEGKWSLVMEYLENKSLYDYIGMNEPLEQDKRLQIASDISCGMAYLHYRSIVHRDLKSSNVVLDRHLRAKVTDFGLSIVRNETSTKLHTETCGTIHYMAPEILGLGPIYSEKSDMFAFAIVLWELASWQEPYDGVSAQEIRYAIQQGQRMPLPSEGKQEILELIEQAWNQEKDQRPTFSAVNLKLASMLQIPKPALEDIDFVGQETTKYSSHFQTLQKRNPSASAFWEFATGSKPDEPLDWFILFTALYHLLEIDGSKNKLDTDKLRKTLDPMNVAPNGLTVQFFSVYVGSRETKQVFQQFVVPTDNETLVQSTGSHTLQPFGQSFDTQPASIQPFGRPFGQNFGKHLGKPGLSLGNSYNPELSVGNSYNQELSVGESLDRAPRAPPASAASFQQQQLPDLAISASRFADSSFDLHKSDKPYFPPEAMESGSFKFMPRMNDSRPGFELSFDSEAPAMPAPETQPFFPGPPVPLKHPAPPKPPSPPTPPTSFDRSPQTTHRATRSRKADHLPTPPESTIHSATTNVSQSFTFPQGFPFHEKHVDKLEAKLDLVAEKLKNLPTSDSQSNADPEEKEEGSKLVFNDTSFIIGGKFHGMTIPEKEKSFKLKRISDHERIEGYRRFYASLPDLKAQLKMNQKLAKEDNTQALEFLGFYYYDQPFESSLYFRKLAELNHPVGLLQMGIAYQFGRGVVGESYEKNEWVKWISKQISAAYTNPTIAISYYQRASELGSTEAMYRLSLLYESQKDQRYKQELIKACELGDEQAQALLVQWILVKKMDLPEASWTEKVKNELRLHHLQKEISKRQKRMSELGNDSFSKR